MCFYTEPIQQLNSSTEMPKCHTAELNLKKDFTLVKVHLLKTRIGFGFFYMKTFFARNFDVCLFFFRAQSVCLFTFTLVNMLIKDRKREKKTLLNLFLL